MKQPWDVIVAGAGAAGLFFAARAARRGLAVLVLDPGAPMGGAARKVRVSGGGRCNFTNLDMDPGRYLCANPHFTRSALARFTPWDAVAWLGEHGLGYEEKAPGQLFCAQGAAAVATALEADCAGAGVRLELGRPVRGVERAGDGFSVATEGGALAARAVAVATGGLSWPAVGASGLGFEVAAALGLRVEPPRPALVPLVCGSQGGSKGGSWPYADLAGVALPARVACAGAAFTDDLLFTHKGLSGPVILQISTYWRRGAALSIDLLPGQDAAALLAAARSAKGRGRALVRNFLAAHLPARLAARLAAQVAAPAPAPRPGAAPLALADTPLADLTAPQLHALAQALGAWTVLPTRSEGWAKAEVTAGGVDTAVLSSQTMAARHIPGLYFLGEVQDVTGHLGGYNLHWAWASAHAAALAVG
ncbi:aminoacetone oxidase family FAD-binding enzyme [Desulfocurvus vexinensis]|uniref:aminoacetone oxidase family FAD-binding enzyme n=1 Tax=Desulfocurvus vexinensis TaxID=399548 RepID=UPI00048CC426|nr:aminoacetone oxidase family FAD-binding enzyme [Desulfocurvus vexinensis]